MTFRKVLAKEMVEREKIVQSYDKDFRPWVSINPLHQQQFITEYLYLSVHYFADSEKDNLS